MAGLHGNGLGSSPRDERALKARDIGRFTTYHVMTLLWKWKIKARDGYGLCRMACIAFVPY